MKKSVLIIVSVIMILQSCKIENINGQRLDQKSLLCNDSSIFKSPLRFYDRNAKLQYSIMNDDDNLFIYIKATEKIAQLKIIRSGILIKIDTTGKQKKGLSILYPIPNSKKNNIAAINYNNDWEIFVSRFSYDHAYMKITGFKNINDEELLTNNNQGISVAITWDENQVLRFKAIIPFKQIKANSNITLDTNQTIGLSFILASIEQKSKESEGSTTALSNSEERALLRGNVRTGNNPNSLLTEDQMYLTNLKSIKFNYIPVKR